MYRVSTCRSTKNVDNDKIVATYIWDYANSLAENEWYSSIRNNRFIGRVNWLFLIWWRTNKVERLLFYDCGASNNIRNGGWARWSGYVRLPTIVFTLISYVRIFAKETRLEKSKDRLDYFHFVFIANATSSVFEVEQASSKDDCTNANIRHLYSRQR